MRETPDADRRGGARAHGGEHRPAPDAGGTFLRGLRRGCRHHGETGGGGRGGRGLPRRSLRQARRAAHRLGHAAAGAVTENAIAEIAGHLAPGDTVIDDGGNTFWKDDIRRSKALAEKGLTYLDIGTSGGVWGWSAAIA